MTYRSRARPPRKTRRLRAQAPARGGQRRGAGWNPTLIGAARWNPAEEEKSDLPRPLDAKLKRLEAKLKRLTASYKRSKKPESKEKVRKKLEVVVVELAQVAEMSERLAKKRAKLHGAVDQGVLPSLAMKPVFYDAVAVGRKTLTTRKPSEAERIGLEEGEVAEMLMQISRRAKKKEGAKDERPPIRIWVESLGKSPSGVDLIASAGGWDDWVAGEALTFKDSQEEALFRKGVEDDWSGYTLYRLHSSDPRPASAKREGLLTCGSKKAQERPPQLYVMPVNPSMMKRYLAAVTVALSERADVRKAISAAPDEYTAIQAVQNLVLNLGEPTELSIPVEQAVQIINLAGPGAMAPIHRAKAPAKVPWKKRRTFKADPSVGLTTGGQLPLSFGLLSTYFGKPGDNLSIRSAFGVSPYAQGWGAYSLSGLVTAWEKAQDRHKGMPTFFRAYGLAPGGLPIVAILWGTRVAKEGYTITGFNPEVSQAKNFSAVAQAMAWGNSTGAVTSVCFVLPPEVYTMRNGKPYELTGVDAFQRGLVDSPYSPVKSFSEAASLLPKPRRGADSATEKRVSAISARAPLIRFYRTTPRPTAGTFFGESPYAQNWPAAYTSLAANRYALGSGPKALADWMKSGEMTLQDYRDAVADLDADEAYQATSAQRGELYRRTGKKARAPELYISNLTPVQRATVTLGQYMDPGPYQGMLVPVKMTVATLNEDALKDDKIKWATRPVYTLGLDGGERVVQFQGKDKDEPPIQAKVTTMEEYHRFMWTHAPSEYLPPMEAEVWIVNTLVAAEALWVQRRLRLISEDLPAGTSTVKRLLRTKGQAIGSGERWYLVIPPVEFLRMKKNFTAVVDETSIVQAVKKAEPTSDYSAYTQGKENIRRVARDLLRVDLRTTRGKPELLPVHPGATVPWDSESVPYLLREVPAYSKEHGKEKLVGPQATEADLEPDYDTYVKSIAKTFTIPRRSEDVKGGIEGTIGGYERRGKRTKRGRAQEGQFVPTAGDAATRGFYSLARKVLMAQGLTPLDTEEDFLRVLHGAIEEFWADLLPLINAQRTEEGRELLPDTAPPPVAGYASGKYTSLPSEEEAEALMALTTLLTQGSQGIEVLFKDKKLVHPSRSPVGGFHGEGVDHFFPPEVQDEIMALDNPYSKDRRGRRAPRKPRKPRRGARQAHSNPMDETQWSQMRTWLAEGGDLDTKGMFRRPESKEELFAAVRELFPRQKEVSKLGDTERLAGLVHHDLFPRFRSPEARYAEGGGLAPIEVNIAAKLLDSGFRHPRGKDPSYAPDETTLTPDEAKYLAEHGDLSFLEGRLILAKRRESKKEARMTSASGVLCREYRNARRLRGYVPALPVHARNTLWILIGPPTQDENGNAAGPTRVMSFRNGSYVDCDMLIKPGEPFSVALGRAIKGMVLWLGEKGGIRAKRMQSLKLGLIGSPLVRTLWAGDDTRIDARTMTQKAYTGSVEGLWNALSKIAQQRAEAQSKANEDRKAYWAAQREAGDPLTPMHYDRRTVEARAALFEDEPPVSPVPPAPPAPPVPPAPPAPLDLPELPPELPELPPELPPVPEPLPEEPEVSFAEEGEVVEGGDLSDIEGEYEDEYEE